MMMVSFFGLELCRFETNRSEQQPPVWTSRDFRPKSFGGIKTVLNFFRMLTLK